MEAHLTDSDYVRVYLLHVDPVIYPVTRAIFLFNTILRGKNIDDRRENKDER